MKRNTIVSIATILALAAGVAQAEDALEQGVIKSGMTGASAGSYEDPAWKEEYPFPRNFSNSGDGGTD